MDATILGGLLVSHSFELLHVLYLFFVKRVEFFSESTFFILEHLELKLINFFHLVFVDVVEFRFFQVELTVLIHHSESIWNLRQAICFAFDLVFPLAILLHLLDIFLLLINLLYPDIDFSISLTLVPHFSSPGHSLMPPPKSDLLFVTPSPPILAVFFFKFNQILFEGLNIEFLLNRIRLYHLLDLLHLLIKHLEEL